MFLGNVLTLLICKEGKMLPHENPPQLCFLSVERGNTQDKLNIFFEIASDLLIPGNLTKEMEVMITKRMISFTTQCGEGAAMFAHKNLYYGDSIRFGGLLGAIYEMFGILGRLNNLAIQPDDISDNIAAISDSLEDLHNYAVIARMMLFEGNIKGDMFG